MFYSVLQRTGQPSRNSSAATAERNQSGPGVLGDWICSKCGVHNFKRREQCFKCHVSRDESDRSKDGDGYDQVGHNPCNTLVLRGLDALTTEESILTSIARISALGVKNLRVMRSERSGVSLGYAFLEMNAISEASQFIEAINRLNIPFEVDGKAVIVNFSKNTFSTVMATFKQQQQQQQSMPDTWNQYYSQQATSSLQGDVTNAAAAVAQAAMNSTKQAKSNAVSSVPSAPKADSTTSSQYPVPDVSTFQYDESSGYYYDPVTTLYYDSSSQYFYNSHTGQFLYWDSDKHSYLPAPTAPNNGSGDAAATSSEAAVSPDTPVYVVTVEKKEKEKKEKVKIAKKIAKDMEKWAKQMNSQKEAEKELKKQVNTPIAVSAAPVVVDPRREPATADAGFAVLEKTAVATMMNEAIAPPPIPYTANSPPHPHDLVASYGGDSDTEDLDEEKLVDVEKMACLLCKRRFNSIDILQKHCQMSDLHKSNLEELRSKNQAGGSSPNSQQRYRDRAKERRQKYGAPPPPVPRGKKSAPVVEDSIFEQPTQQGIGTENIGNKLLQKMGWSEGKGLGRTHTGIVDPITATRRQRGVGLGAGAIVASIDASDTYKTAAKKTLFARFSELE